MDWEVGEIWKEMREGNVIIIYWMKNNLFSIKIGKRKQNAT